MLKPGQQKEQERSHSLMECRQPTAEVATAISVVIAEDDRQIAEIQRRFISRVPGFEVTGIAHSLLEARDLTEVLAPDLVLLDVQFPDGTGLELLGELRARQQAVDVILVTAAKEVETLKAALHGGVFDYILKPLIFDRLQQALTRYQEHHQRLLGLQSLQQSEVDGLLAHSFSVSSAETQAATSAEITERLPKGIDPLTLEKITELLQSQKGEASSAEQVGKQIGASRTTARRYLEFLVSQQAVAVEVSYGSVGRPERRYKV